MLVSNVKNIIQPAERTILFSVGYVHVKQNELNSIYSNKSYFNKQLKCNGS